MDTELRLGDTPDELVENLTKSETHIERELQRFKEEGLYVHSHS